MRPLAIVLIVSLLAGPVSAHAAQAAREAAQSAAANEPSRVPPAQPATEFPVSIDRIRRRLAQTPPSTTKGLRLDYYVEVYGKSPRIDVLADFDTTAGGVQYGSPTHQEFLDLVTPQEFKSPPADLMTPAVALIKWLTDKARDKSKKK